MRNSILKILWIAFFPGLMLVPRVNAQKEICDLELRFFEYGSKQGHDVIANLSLSASGPNYNRDSEGIPGILRLPDRGNGRYKVVLKKEGFEKRSKQFELDCGFADDENTFRVNIYLKRKDAKLLESPDLIKRVASQNEKADRNADLTGTSETVTLKILIDVDGNVVSAKALDGKSELVQRAKRSIRRMKFMPTIRDGEPIQVAGNIVYKFSN